MSALIKAELSSAGIKADEGYISREEELWQKLVSLSRIEFTRKLVRKSHPPQVIRDRLSISAICFLRYICFVFVLVV